MGSNRKAAHSRGDVMRRLDALEAEIDHLKTARRLPNSSYAAGGPRTRGGRFLAEDLSGDKVFEVTTEPPDIFMRPELIAAVARQVIGQSVLFDVRAGTGFRDAFSTFGDIGLVTPSAGPQISFDLEGESFLAIWGAQVTISGFQNDLKSAYMDVEVDGPSPYTPPNSPTIPNAAFLENHLTVDPPAFVGISGSTVNARRFTASPGSYTVTGKYRFDESNNPPLNSMGWRQRFLIVIVF